MLHEARKKESPIPFAGLRVDFGSVRADERFMESREFLGKTRLEEVRRGCKFSL
ncbi:hypothetical protein RISK_005720 [Rhodopirellula islandica]|uniref:Uncharacterized protein n=1 Tax=Rhodopirellula islandica TaxID=595434 RepID=A0A0J1EAJ5_RHOIS|nr:hypothetical protein RISK_005720 [Rhodopirellula islandica]